MSYELRQLHDLLSRLAQGQADLEARIERMFRKGPVTDVDADQHLYRQEIGLDDDGQPVKSPWLPFSQVAGGRKTHSMPSVGEQYMLVNPDGGQDFTSGLGMPHGWYDQNPSPSTDPNADVTTRGTTTDTTTISARTISVGNATVKLQNGQITLSVGGSQLLITGSQITLTSAKIVTVGETHLGADGGIPASHLGTVDTGGNADITNLATKVFVT